MAARRSIYRKYLALIIALVAGALVVSGAIGVYFSYLETRHSLFSLAQEKAVTTTKEKDATVRVAVSGETELDYVWRRKEITAFTGGFDGASTPGDSRSENTFEGFAAVRLDVDLSDQIFAVVEVGTKRVDNGAINFFGEGSALPVKLREAHVLKKELFMPELDGLQVLGWIRENMKDAPFPVVVLTASMQAEDESRALQLGAHSVHGKPGDLDGLSRRSAELERSNVDLSIALAGAMEEREAAAHSFALVRLPELVGERSAAHAELVEELRRRVEEARPVAARVAQAEAEIAVLPLPANVVRPSSPQLGSIEAALLSSWSQAIVGGDGASVPIRFAQDIRVTIQALGWRSGGRYVPLQDDISSVAFWYQTLPTAPFPKLPPKDELEIV